MQKLIPDNVLRDALAKAMGEPAVLVSDVRYDLRNPCADCPFMKTSPFHQGVAKSLPALVESIEAHSFAHTCHKTDTRPQCDGPVAGKETNKPVQHCIGSLMMLLKTGDGKDLQLPMFDAIDAGKLTIEDVNAITKRAKADERVFALPELLRFYYRRLLRMVRRKK